MSSLIKQDGGFVGAVTMTSREIADLVGKRHDSVKRTIETLVSKGVIVQPQSVDEQSRDSMGRNRPTQVYVFSGEQGKRDSIVVVAQLSPEFTARLVDRWQELEAQAKLGFNPDDNIQVLEHLLETKKKNVVLQLERDEAIRTKAQIGSRREATAMAKASAAVRKANKLEHELGRNQHHATVTAVERVTGEKFPRNAYVALRRWCKKHNAKPVDVVDERYGTVKAWPAGAWLSEFDVNLAALFGVAANGGGGESSHGGLA